MFLGQEKSCIIGLPCTVMSTVRLARPSTPITEYCTVFRAPCRT